VRVGDYADLSLTFTATVVEPAPSSSGTRQREIELKPGGCDIAVKPDNVIEYIHRLADFRLNRQMDRAAAAFLRGFFELIKPRWVRMFNEAELQMLISGSEEGVDVEDLMKHINYAGERNLRAWGGGRRFGGRGGGGRFGGRVGGGRGEGFMRAAAGHMWCTS
jgi:hypothetical protein